MFKPRIVRPLPQTVEELNSWTPTIDAPSMNGLYLKVFAVLFVIGVLVGYTFSELSTFNATVTQVMGP